MRKGILSAFLCIALLGTACSGAEKTQAGTMETQADTAETQAGTMETQAGITENETGTTEFQADTAETQAETTVPRTGLSQTGEGTGPGRRGTEAAPEDATDAKDATWAENDIFLTSAPEMTVAASAEAAVKKIIRSGNYEWSVKKDDGTSEEVVACGAHPLDSAVKREDCVPEGTAVLYFPVFPDEVEIRVWGRSSAGNPEQFESVGEAVKLSADHSLEVEKNKIYEVTSIWSRDRGYSGSASYSFCSEE